MYTIGQQNEQFMMASYKISDELPDWWTAGVNTVCTTDQFTFVRIPKLHSPTNNSVSRTWQLLTLCIFPLAKKLQQIISSPAVKQQKF